MKDLKQYEEWLLEEQVALWAFIWTWSFDDSYVITRVNQIEGCLELIKEFENE